MNTIVLQDTDQDILYVLGFALRQEGYIVHTTSSLDEHILELIAEAKPHVVILDYRMNGENAIRACHLIPTLYPNLPVIATSCNTNILKDYHAGGFDDYLDKPFDLNALDGLIRKHIAPVQFI